MSRMEFFLACPCIGGSSGKVSNHFVSAALKESNVSNVVIWAGILFHKLGPLTPKDESYRLRYFLLASLGIMGTVARMPLRSLYQNSIFRSFEVMLWRILNIMMIVYLSLLLCSDISLRDFSLS